MGARGKAEPKAGGRKPRGARPREPRPWERQAEETLSAFEAFVIFRDMPTRSAAGVAVILGRNERSVKKQAVEHNWDGRALAWDNELDRRIQSAEVQALQEMRRRQIQVAVGMQTAAALELQALVRQVEQREANAKAAGVTRAPLLGVRELVRLIEAGAKLERVNRGEPDSIVATVTEAPEENLDALSVDELKAFKVMQAKMKAAAGR